MDHRFVVRFPKDDPETPPTMNEQIELARQANRKLGVPNAESKPPNSNTGEVWAYVALGAVAVAAPHAKVAIVAALLGARIAKPINARTMPTTTAIAATPNATTEVNSDACRNGVRRHRTVRVLPVEFGVRLAAGDLLRVLVDHPRLAERRERPFTSSSARLSASPTRRSSASFC